MGEFMMHTSKLDHILSERNINKNGFFRKIGEKVYGKAVLSGTYVYWLKTGKVPDDVKPAIAEELGVTIEGLFFDMQYK
ncbi:MAG: hypothetical protein Q8J63_00655 [Candidatus Aquicultor sp.]|nr:hypothetical protein [Candidatus Aquicultor sp.]